MTFTTELQSWHDVYLAAAGVAATLAGLLFVGLSLHLRTVVSHPDVRALARVTLSSFFTVVIASVYMLVPVPDAPSLGIPMLGMAAGATLLMLRPAWSGFGNRRSRSLTLGVLAIRFGTTLVSYLTLGAAGAVFVLTNQYQAGFQAQLVAIMVLLIISVRNTWDLLVTIADNRPS